jgi:hypothetical protein
MTAIRDLKPAVTPLLSHVEQLKHEVYTLGTSIRQVSSESGMSPETVKSILAGNNVEQTSAARLEAYLKALARNEFYATRSLKHFDAGAMSGQANRLSRLYYALNRELWDAYKLTSLHPDKFAKLTRRQKLCEFNNKDRMAKLALLSAHKPFIEQHRIWFADGWNYWRWKNYLKRRQTAATIG